MSAPMPTGPAAGETRPARFVPWLEGAIRVRAAPAAWGAGIDMDKNPLVGSVEAELRQSFASVPFLCLSAW